MPAVIAEQAHMTTLDHVNLLPLVQIAATDIRALDDARLAVAHAYSTPYAASAKVRPDETSPGQAH